MAATFEQALNCILTCDDKALVLLGEIIAERPALLNEKSKEGYTLLHAVFALEMPQNTPKVQAVRRAMIICLISAILKYENWVIHPFNMQNARGNTPLHLALIFKAYDIAELLLSYKYINLEIANAAGKQALDIAHDNRADLSLILKLTPPIRQPVLTQVSDLALSAVHSLASNWVGNHVQSTTPFVTQMHTPSTVSVISADIPPSSPAVKPQVRTFSKACNEAKLAINLLHIRHETSNPFVAFQNAVDAVMNLEQESLEVRSEQTVAILTAFNQLSNQDKLLARPHLEVLSNELKWCLDLTPHLSEAFDILSQKLPVQNTKYKELNALLAELMLVLTEIKQAHEVVDGQDKSDIFCRELRVIIQATSSLIDEVQKGTDISKVGATYSKSVIPAIIALEGMQGQWYESFHNIMMTIVNLLFGNDIVAITANTQSATPIKNPIGVFEAWKLSESRNKIVTVLSSRPTLG